MLGPEVIHDMQLEAAARASREGRTPFVPWRRGEIRNAPFIGPDYVPAGWRPISWSDVPDVDRPRGSSFWHGDQAALFVDSSGLGALDEPALTLGEADDWVWAFLRGHPGQTYGLAILQAGEFQVYLGLYVKDGTASAQNQPDPSYGLCPHCGEPDGVFDYHECPLGEEAD